MAMATTASCTGPTVDLMPLRRRGLHYKSKWSSTTSPFSVDELSDFPRPLGLCDGLYCPPPTRSLRSVQQPPSAPTSAAAATATASAAATSASGISATGFAADVLAG